MWVCLERIPCRYCGKRDGDGHLFWECIFPPLPLQHVRELPEFAYLLSLNRSNWPCCLLWYGWLPGLSGLSDRDPWATSFGDLASFFHLERCLGACPVDIDGCWTPPESWDADDIALEMSEHPDESWEDFSSVGLTLLVVCTLSASELAFEGSF